MPLPLAAAALPRPPLFTLVMHTYKEHGRPKPSHHAPNASTAVTNLSQTYIAPVALPCSLPSSSTMENLSAGLHGSCSSTLEDIAAAACAGAGSRVRAVRAAAEAGGEGCGGVGLREMKMRRRRAARARSLPRGELGRKRVEWERVMFGEGDSEGDGDGEIEVEGAGEDDDGGRSCSTSEEGGLRMLL